MNPATSVYETNHTLVGSAGNPTLCVCVRERASSQLRVDSRTFHSL